MTSQQSDDSPAVPSFNTQPSQEREEHNIFSQDSNDTAMVFQQELQQLTQESTNTNISSVSSVSVMLPPGTRTQDAQQQHRAPPVSRHLYDAERLVSYNLGEQLRALRLDHNNLKTQHDQLKMQVDRLFQLSNQQALLINELRRLAIQNGAQLDNQPMEEEMLQERFNSP